MTGLRERLTQDRILVYDGATGTFLQRAGLPSGMAPDRWNLENPDAIETMHRDYVDAGADLILTNTFGSSRPRLEKEGLADRMREVILVATHLAHRAAGDSTFVLGDIGPTGELMKPLGVLTHEDAVAVFTEQADFLAEGGVDGIAIETMSDLGEAEAAVEGVQQATDLPVLVTMSFDMHGHTMMGVGPVQAGQALWALGVDGVGANCGRALDENLDAIRQMREAMPDSTLVAKPNAGLPHRIGDEMVYDVTPEMMADYARKFAQLGVKMFGGCCGSTPEHIKAVAQALHD